jgi:BirA family biotin operon repressor/biotin-[acetyl-CoA-carboxylase] ligase
MLIRSKLYYFDTIDSTNEYAKSLLKEAPEGTVVLANEQTDGKGRFGKSWYSPTGGLWMSVILRPRDAALVFVMAAVAVCSTLSTFGITPGIKWPNDIMLNGKKIGGILTEILHNIVIVGIGINLVIRKFPETLRTVATSVSLETKKYFDKKMVFDILCRNLDECYWMLNNKKEHELLNRWRDYTILLGQNVELEIGEERITCKVVDIDNNGQLVVRRTDGTVQHVAAGICHLCR